MFIDGTEYQTGPGRCSQQVEPGQIGVLHEVRLQMSQSLAKCVVCVVCDVCAAVDACWSSMLTHISACGGYRLMSGIFLYQFLLFLNLRESLSLSLELVISARLATSDPLRIHLFLLCPRLESQACTPTLRFCLSG